MSDANQVKQATLTKAELVEQRKREWLHDHLPYELIMMRYCLKRMPRSQKQREYNMAYAAFAVHACNLAAFVTNGDTRNLRASDFVQNFRSRKSDEVRPRFDKLEGQVFHLGKARPKKEGKFTVEDADVVGLWLEREMEKFVAMLDAHYRKFWNAKLCKTEPPADPVSPTC